MALHGKSLFYMVMDMAWSLVQVAFSLVILGIALILVFLVFLTVQWLVVATIVKPATVLPYGTGVITLYTSAVATTSAMQAKAKKLRAMLRQATEYQMKRQFLLYTQRKHNEQQLLTTRGRRSAITKITQAQHTSILSSAEPVASSAITDLQIANVEPTDIFHHFATRQGAADHLDEKEFHDIFRDLGWAATEMEREQMFAHCDVSANDSLLTAEEWDEGWAMLLDLQV